MIIRNSRHQDFVCETDKNIAFPVGILHLQSFSKLYGSSDHWTLDYGCSIDSGMNCLLSGKTCFSGKTSFSVSCMNGTWLFQKRSWIKSLSVSSGIKSVQYWSGHFNRSTWNGWGASNIPIFLVPYSHQTPETGCWFWADDDQYLFNWLDFNWLDWHRILWFSFGSDINTGVEYFQIYEWLLLWTCICVDFCSYSLCIHWNVLDWCSHKCFQK